MHSGATHRQAWPLTFLFLVTAVYATAIVVAGQLSHVEQRSSAVAIALTFDLVIVVPLAFYVLVVRPRALPIVTLAPIVLLSVLGASRVLPADQQQTLNVLQVLAAPLELGLIGWIAWRAARALRHARRDTTGDPLEFLRKAAFELTKNQRAAAVFATEIAVFLYAIGSWQARAHAPRGTSAFSYHRRSGHAAIVLGFILALLVEGLAMHFLLRSWSSLFAWVFTLGTVYSALWLIADYRATVLRPILVSHDSVLIRAGLRCTLHVPLARIAAVAHKKPDFGRESINLTFLSTPTYWLTLSEPMVAEGPYGFRRPVRAFGIEPDAGEDFARLLRERSV